MTTGKAAAIETLYQSYAATEVLRRVADGKRLVTPAGPFDAPLVLVGEAPGEDEENTGAPFTGPSGKLLRQLFGEARIPWDACYRTNVLPWRPPGNRTPYPFEIAASAMRLEEEIRIVSPLVVVAAGAVAWQCVTRKAHGPFSDHRGKWMSWSSGEFSCDLLAVYHPAAILRAPGVRGKDMRAETAGALASVLEGERAT